MIDDIGFVGLGSMGEGMVRNLLKAGFSVRGFDIDPAAVSRVAGAGAHPAHSPAEAADGVGVLAICVFNADQAEETLFGASGALQTLPEGATVAMHTTMAPERVRQLGARLAHRGHPMVDAPVTGGKAGADRGILTIIASGTDRAMTAADPAFRAMGKRIYRTGDRAGAASTVKMINQLLVGIQTVAAAEAISLAAKAGADPNVVYDVITHGGGNSASFKNHIPFILAGDFDLRGALEIFTKDLGIVTDAADRLDFPVPLTRAALARYQAAVEAGLGRCDGASVVKVYEREGDVDVRASARSAQDDRR